MKWIILTFVVLSFGTLPSAAFSPAVLSAANCAVDKGSSLEGTPINTLMNDGYRVTCGIEIENWTKFPLEYPATEIYAGKVSVPPSVILPSKKEVMVARKTAYSIAGSEGTVSWSIRGKNRRLVVMWSAPFSFIFHSNWLAVGLTKKGVEEHAPGNSWYDIMYNRISTPNLQYSTNKYSQTVRPVIYSDEDFEVVGTMGTTHKAHVKIIFAPRNNSDLAEAILAHFGKLTSLFKSCKM